MKGRRHPHEMTENEPRLPVSARIKPATLRILKKAAKENKLLLSALVANIIDDYAEWLEGQK